MSNDDEMDEQQNGETNRWLVGIIGAVGAMAIVIIVGFQAQVDQRQDEALNQVAKQVERSEARDERITDTLSDVARQLAVLEAREEERKKR